MKSFWMDSVLLEANIVTFLHPVSRTSKSYRADRGPGLMCCKHQAFAASHWGNRLTVSVYVQLLFAEYYSTIVPWGISPVTMSYLRAEWDIFCLINTAFNVPPETAALPGCISTYFQEKKYKWWIDTHTLLCLCWLINITSLYSGSSLSRTAVTSSHFYKIEETSWISNHAIKVSTVLQ